MIKKTFLILSAGLCLFAATTGLDTAVRIQDGSDSRNTKSSRVTVGSMTNLKAGTITATNSVTVGESGQVGTLTANYGLNITNELNQAYAKFDLTNFVSLKLYNASGGGVRLTDNNGSAAGMVNTPGTALWLGVSEGLKNVVITATYMAVNNSGNTAMDLGSADLGGAFSNLWIQGGVFMVRTQALNFYTHGAGTPQLKFSIDPTSGIQSAYRTLTDGATVTLTCDVAKTIQHDTVTLGGNRTLAISGAVSGMEGTLIVKQDATGSRTLTLPASSKVINGGSGAITLSTTANAIDILTWTYDGSNYYWNYGKNYN